MFGDVIRRISGRHRATDMAGLLDITPHLIGVSVDDRLVYANRASQKLLGFKSLRAIRGRSIYEFVHEDDRAKARESVERARTLREAGPFFEVRLVAGDGKVLDVEVWLAPFRLGRRDALLIHGRDFSARRRAATALRESEERYRRIAENSSDVITETTATGRLVYVSPSLERVLGYSAKSWTSDVEGVVARLTHPDDLPRLQALISDGLLPEKIEILQRIRHADGEYRWIHSTGRRFTTANGEQRVVMVSRDVSEQQRVVEALRASEKRYQSLARAVPVGIFRIDNKGRHVYLNERWSELTGIPHDVAMANPRSHPLHPEDAGRILEQSRKALAEGGMLRLEQRVIRPDGEMRWVLNQAVPEFDSSGAFAGWVGTLTDLSDKKASEQALAESEERLRLALEGAEMCTWEWDAELGEVRWSTNAARVFGLPDDESMPQTIRGYLDLVHPDDLESGRAFARERADRLEPFEVEFRLAPQPGRDTRWMLMRGHGGPERRRCAVGVIADVTPRRRLAEERAELEARLRESQRLESLGLLAGGVAHDFNNLLVGILGNAELAVERAGKDTVLRESLEEVQRAGARAAGLVKQILAFAGRERIASERMDLRALVDETLDLLRRALPQRAKIDWLAPAEPVEVEGDATQLRQVLMNLVTNACEALPAEGGHVSVRVTRAESGEVALDVSDTGCGVEPAALAKIFDPFFTTKGAGRGLGLAVAHGVVRAHGGSVAVDSAPGRGARMRVLLPAAPPLASDAESRSDSLSAPERGAGAVLVVDDERGVREVARRALEAAGYSVLLAADRGEAIAQLRAHGAKVAAIVLDLALGSESGEELLAELRALAAETPVLATSGYAGELALRRLEAQGIAGFVQKPFTASSLARSIAEVIRPAVS